MTHDGSELRAAPNLPGTRILGLGHFRPANVVTNADLIARGVDTNDEWIQSRVGIAERHYAADGETVVDMAEAAGRNALAASGVAADDIDLVLVATCTMPTPVPAAAPQLAYRLGIDSPGAFDVNSGCSGFMYALSTASAAVQAGHATQRAGRRGRALLGLDRLQRPHDLHHPRRRGRRGGRRAERRGRARPGRLGQRRARSPTRSRSTRRPTSSARRARRSIAGPPRRWRRSRSRPAGGPASSPRSSPRSSRTRPTCASSTRSPSGSARPTRSSPATSSPRATPRPPRSRSRCRGWSRPARSPSGAPVLLLGFGSGLAYAGQVVLAP